MKRGRVLRTWQPAGPEPALPSLGWVPLLALVAALVPRAVVLWGADFPLNDGGMTAVMVEELVHGRFLPPLETAYNHLGIPWAYPPLAFVLAALAVALGAGDVHSVLLWMPLVLNLASVVAFSWTAEALVRSRGALAAATVAFAIMPFSFNWQLMGAGLPRAAGLLFAILTVGAACRLFERRRRRDAILTSVFAAAAILSHPEMPVLCGTLLACLWLVRGRNWPAIRVGVAVAAGTLILTAPWWLSVVLRYGVGPLTAAANTVEWSLTDLAPLPLLRFTGESSATALAVLAVVGAAWEIAHKRFVTPLWLLAAFAVPRLGLRPATIPAAILVGVALGELITPAIAQAAEGGRRRGRLAAHALATILLGHALVMVTTEQVAYRQGNPFLARDERAAMHWVAESTPSGASFLVVTSASSWAEDPVIEWFPALADRQSVTTPQGSEWLSGGEFLRRGRAYDSLEPCRSQGLPCLSSWLERQGIGFDFVFVSKVPRGPISPAGLATQMASSSRFAVVYENPGAVVFAFR